MGCTIKAVAFDTDERTVEVPFFEGEVDEFELNNWYQLGVVAIAPQEGWPGPFNDLVHDDFGNTEQPMHPVDRNGPADKMEQED